jgi:hypothetical protein
MDAANAAAFAIKTRAVAAGGRRAAGRVARTGTANSGVASQRLGVMTKQKKRDIFGVDRLIK